ncbi:MAG: radical SAM protein [Zhenhengia yiwuensis]|nr:radical SAM protein [Zhenhengia yiwuensis]MDY3369497.1 radical SAM protein [Zhenhengia yiwuensis]
METLKISAKSILIKNKDLSWFGAEYNMNLYKGCSHGCIYCDSRSECYHIEQFDTVRIKANAIQILEGELRRKRGEKATIFTGSMSDPYNPLENKLELTRHALELIEYYGFGVSVATKSNLIIRDIDLFKAIGAKSPVLTKMTITTADDALAQKIEPYVSVSSKRFEAIRNMSEEGIFTGILMMPLLPFIEDTEENIFEIVKKAYESGVKFIYPAIGMTMRIGQREYFYSQLDKHFPGMKEKYIGTYGNQYKCVSQQARQLFQLFADECKARGILYKMPQIIEAYKKGYRSQQLSLF